MKRLRIYFSCMAIAAFALTACSSSEDTPDTSNSVSVSLSPESIQASANGGTYTISVSTSAKEWTAYAADDCKDWVTATANVAANTITATIAKNTGEGRTGNVYFKHVETRKPVVITQTAPLAVSKNSVYFNAEGGQETVTVSGVTDWTATASDAWVTVSKDGENLNITTAANTGVARSATITITAADETATVEVSQEAYGDAGIEAPAGYTTANLVWHDEFNEGTSLSSDWTHEHQAAYWVNSELQTYSDGKKDGTNITEIKDGHLNINCFKAKDGKIYSGRVYAKVSTGWTYGYFEARIKLPVGKGTWPAWWMMPANNNYSTNPWPGCGEIDIMEEVGVDANNVSSTIHCNKYNNGNTKTEHGTKYVSTAESEFHTYGCEWNKDYLEFFVDGESILKYKPSSKTKDYWPFDVPFYPILNLAWGGSWGGYKGVDESALPVQMQVDWVRIYQK